MKKYFLYSLTATICLLQSIVLQSFASEPKSLLWKISGNGLLKDSYLFGTMHKICSEDYFFNQNMNTAFQATEQLILEVDITNNEELMSYTQKIILPQGTSLKGYFASENEFNTFSQKIKELYDIDITQFLQFKPIFLFSMLAEKSFMCNKTSSYEMNLIQMAQDKKMNIVGLESLSEQLKIFDDMDTQEIIAMMNQSINDTEDDQKLLNEMIQAYKTQDIALLKSLIINTTEYKMHEDKLINDRNKNWASTLPEMIKTKSAFIAVGAGHLAGKEGVLQLLKNKGYTVTPVL